MSHLEAQLQAGSDRDAVRDAVICLGDTLDGTLGSDSADNHDTEAAMRVLTYLLGNIDSRIAAEGVQSALHELLARWMMREDSL